MTLNDTFWWWLWQHKPANSESSGQDPEDPEGLGLFLALIFILGSMFVIGAVSPLGTR